MGLSIADCEHQRTAPASRDAAVLWPLDATRARPDELMGAGKHLVGKAPLQLVVDSPLAKRRPTPPPRRYRGVWAVCSALGSVAQ